MNFTHHNFLGDIEGSIKDIELRILLALEQELLNYELLLVSSFDIIIELDVILSLTLSAHDYNFVKPNLVDDTIISVKNGRHPLQEMTVDTFIPNDILIAPGIILFILKNETEKIYYDTFVSKTYLKLGKFF